MSEVQLKISSDEKIVTDQGMDSMEPDEPKAAISTTLSINEANDNDLRGGEEEDDLVEAEGDVDNDEQLPTYIAGLVTCHKCWFSVFERNELTLKRFLKVLLLVGLCVYLIIAFRHSFGDDQSLTLLGIVCFLVTYWIISRLLGRYSGPLQVWLNEKETNSNSPTSLKFIYWCAIALASVCLILFVIIDSAIRRPQNLVSMLGIFGFTLFMLVISKHPQKIVWRPVLGGLMLQFIFGLLVIKADIGFFKWLADRVTEYLDHTDKGSSFVFGNSFRDHYVAFKVLPCIVFFSSTISILYYLGTMQVAINCVTSLMRQTLNTGPMETLHAAFNIFVGWAETIPVIMPLMDDMSHSELHAIMTNGFSTVSGGTMAAYILYGAPAKHLISASIMSAPAALALSKLTYPEKDTARQNQDAPNIESRDRGIIEAASNGAISAIPVVAYILAVVLAFLSLFDFINDTLAWLGARVGVEPPAYPVLSFQYISSYVMWPLALMMGVEISDCRPVARIIGVKIFVNEFLAFGDLGVVRGNNRIFRDYTRMSTNATWHWTSTDDIVLDTTGQVLIGGVISERSVIITTYAICGFSDLVAMGMMVGALSAAAPDRRSEIASLAPRALLTGVMACFLTASVAGLMVE